MAKGGGGRLLTRLVEDLHLPAGAVAADVGCGDGQLGARVLRELGCVVYGCEMDASKAARASAFAKVDVGDVRQWTPPEPLDIILCAELFEHLPAEDQPVLLRSMRGWLRPGGHLILSTPQRNSPVALFERGYTRLRRRPAYDWWDPTHVSILGRRRLEALLADTGFTIERRVGTHLVPELLPVSALHKTQHEGPLGLLGFDLVYVLA